MALFPYIKAFGEKKNIHIFALDRIGVNPSRRLILNP